MVHDRRRGVHHSRSQQVISRSRAIRASPIARRNNENVEADQEDSSNNNNRDRSKLKHKDNSDQDSSKDREGSFLPVPTV